MNFRIAIDEARRLLEGYIHDSELDSRTIKRKAIVVAKRLIAQLLVIGIKNKGYSGVEISKSARSHGYKISASAINR